MAKLQVLETADSDQIGRIRAEKNAIGKNRLFPPFPRRGDKTCQVGRTEFGSAAKKPGRPTGRPSSCQAFNQLRQS
jgi:hypothetical protein